VTRLSGTTVAAALGVDVPCYDRTQTPSIVHLGVGSFARAHVAVYADDLLRLDRRAAIHGVSLRSRRAEADLGPQDGWFTVTTREPPKPPSTRAIGSITAVETGAGAAVDAIANPATALVTLTITEKGYELDGPDAGPAVVAAALDARRRRHGAPIVVASLDNLLDNGSVLEERVLTAAAGAGEDLTDWISNNVRFPRSVVDRMVPSTTSEDLAEVERRLGLADHAAVVAEDHRSWILEGEDVGLALGDVGVELVADIEPYQRRKLWLLNGPHSAFAYGGLLAGHRTIADATADGRVAGFVDGLVEDVLAVLPPDSAATEAFAAASLKRFANPALGHTCAQVAADGSRKLPQRLLPVMDLRREVGLPTGRLATVVAIWLAAAASIPVVGRELPSIDDPASVQLGSIVGDRGVEAAIAAALGPRRAHVPAVLDALGRLTREGVAVLEVSS
jgi:fructuronate reductase